jgi:Leucine-rich repeat (LRR) protein
MTTRRPFVTVLGFFTVALVAMAILLATDAQAITFGQWATNAGWPAGCATPATVNANYASIHNLADVGNYNWAATPTRSLYLHGNQITNLESGAFAGLDSLTELRLGNNQITNIESGAFTGLGNLTALYLNRNQIMSIGSGVFTGLGSLTSLSLDHNQITSIGSGAFTGLGSLTGLSLDHNQITSIESGAFTGLGSLTGLRLDYNQIANIKSDTFTGLCNLTSLYLDGNQITSLQSGDFAGLGSLTFLRLVSNQITSIEPGDFTGLGSLTELELTGNQITRLESGAFAGLGNLRFLRLGSNQITNLKSGTFAGLGNLGTLELDGNPITTLESGAFNGLDGLPSLSLHDNQITSIESGAFSGLANLTTLELYGNQITNLESGAFAGLGSLTVLLLGNNPTLTNLNLDGADFTRLTNRFDVSDDVNISRVSLRDSRLNQTSLAMLIDANKEWSPQVGIAELPSVTELDLSGIDFAPITDLSVLYAMDNVTDLWLADVLNLDANQLDTLLDNLAAMEDPSIEGTLYMTQDDYDAFNAAGGGKLAIWDAEPGHHVQIVPEPGALAMLAGAVVSFWFLRRRGREPHANARCGNSRGNTGQQSGPW